MSQPNDAEMMVHAPIQGVPIVAQPGAPEDLNNNHNPPPLTATETRSHMDALDQWEATDPHAYFRNLRKKVMYLSIGSAFLLVVSGILGYAFNLQGDLSLLQFLEEQGILPEHGGSDDNGDHPHHGGKSAHHKIVVLFFAGLPFLFVGLGMAMCVPGCGYWGAKHLNSRLLGCFFGCSICNVIGGLLSVVFLLWVMACGAPMAEHWVATCDPATVCCGENAQFCEASTGENGKGSVLLPKPEFREQFLDCVMGAFPGYLILLMTTKMH